VEAALRSTFTAEVVDELREQTGYNPRQRLVTAQRLMLVVVEAFLLGQTLGFTAIRAIFLRRFGVVQPCPFQKRFKQASAAAFFRAALERLVESVISSAQLSLTGPLAQFADVRIYDGTGQRVPARGHKALPGCTKGKAGSKWVVSYSIKTGLLEHTEGGAETASETPLRHKLVPSFARGVLYLFDLGFFRTDLVHDPLVPDYRAPKPALRSPDRTDLSVALAHRVALPRNQTSHRSGSFLHGRR
jgi:hypothetical protein